MQYKVSWVENKSSDWKIVSLEDPSGALAEGISINRTNKKGQVFPNFDGIMPGATIEGESWKSPAGKLYLFAPDPKPQYQGETTQGKPSGGFKSGMAKTMELKNSNIEKNMETKQENIQKTGSFRDATLMVTTFYKDGGLNEEELKKKWEEWFKFFTDKYNQPF